MPCLNEAETLQECIQLAQEFLRDSQVVGEILIADNGSIDGGRAYWKQDDPVNPQGDSILDIKVETEHPIDHEALSALCDVEDPEVLLDKVNEQLTVNSLLASANAMETASARRAKVRASRLAMRNSASIGKKVADDGGNDDTEDDDSPL